MVRLSRVIGIGAAIVLVVASATEGTAARADVTFRGKTVRMIVGSPPGGGTDLGGRLFARYIGKYLAESPTIVVQNMPGAGGIKSMNFMAQQAPTDGTVFIAGSLSQITPDVVLNNPVIAYNPAKFAFIGGMASTGTVLVANEGAMDRMASTGAPVAVAQVGGISSRAQLPLWGAEYLGWKLRWVTGYQGTASLTLAMLKGEADMTDMSGPANLEPLLKDGHFRLVAQIGVLSNGEVHRRGSMAEIPTMAELIGPKLSGLAKDAFESWESTTQVGKFFALPPGTPQDYVAAYRAAYLKMGDDAEFRKMATIQVDEDFVLMSGGDVGAVVEKMTDTPAEHLKFLMQIRERYGLAVSDDQKAKD
jgi:tripartite-type tricarboxylate transporter receptor subunit TctC